MKPSDNNKAQINKAQEAFTVFTSKRDGNTKSLWQAGQKKSHNTIQAFEPEKVYDALIIGAGITGLSTALILQKRGLSCIIAEAHSVGFGTSGGTTAHINTFADTTYQEAENGFGKEGAQLFSDAIRESVELIKENINTYKIDCDFAVKKGYLYAEDDQQEKQLDELFNSALKVGVKVAVTNFIPAEIPYKKAVVFEDQYQFHPLKYLQALNKGFSQAGGTLLENTPIDNLDLKDSIISASSGKTIIKAKKTVYATHIPPGGINLLHFRNAPYRSYVIGATLKNDNYPDGLIYDMQDPYHYFRTHEIDGQKYLIAGGNDHKTGQGDPEQSFSDLVEYSKKFFKVESVKFKWSSQYYIPTDGLPYIGHLPGAPDGVYTATGFNGNGVILGSISAKILANLVTNQPDKYSELFAPSRIKPITGFKEFVTENADAAFHFIADRFSVHKVDSVNKIPNGSAEVIQLDGNKIAVYKDETGKVFALNPVCTHAKCIVSWNTAEKSWDCPCHGGRFDVEGTVLTGPPRKNLQKINLEEL